MKQKIDLLHGNILPSLMGLALPIMATSMVQMAYNLTDMAWIGRVGSHAVTAVGSAGMYTWLSGGIVTLARMGGQVKVAHSLGSGRPEDAVEYARGAVQMTIGLALLFGLITNVFAGPLIGFFRLNSPDTVASSVVYLRIACGLILFSFLNQTLTGIFTAIGDSRTPFVANFIGLVINMILDPILIFGWGPFARMEAAGAAIATVAAQLIVTVVLIICATKEQIIFQKIKLWKKTPGHCWNEIVKIGVPSSIQNMLYCGISMVLTRMVASWGDGAVAVQRIGGQVECISWTAAEGFGSAMNAFTGQNYGARLYKRVKKSYLNAVGIIFLWGLMTTGLLILGAEPIFKLFIQEPEVVAMGISYLVIIGSCQLFMCEELMTVGALQGMGKTLSCSAISILLTGARIPLAIYLNGTSLGLNGIWLALSVTSILKGIIFVLYYLWTLEKLPGMRKEPVAAWERK